MSEILEQLLKQWNEKAAKMSPEERALVWMQQKRSYVVSEMMWGSDADEAAGRDAMTREKAEAIYDATSEGIALKALEAQVQKAKP